MGKERAEHCWRGVPVLLAEVAGDTSTDASIIGAAGKVDAAACQLQRLCCLCSNKCTDRTCSFRHTFVDDAPAELG